MKKILASLVFFHLAITPIQAVGLEGESLIDCQMMALGVPLNVQVGILQESVVLMKKTKLEKSERSLVNKARVVMQRMNDLREFPCETVSESNWVEIRPERQSAISKVSTEADLILTQLKSNAGNKIVCYKDGVAKTLTGKNIKCPKGFKLL